MKILRIIARLNIGGPARNAVLLSIRGRTSAMRIQQERGSASNNWETVLVCGGLGAGEGDMTYLAREKGIEPVVVPELGRELSFRNDWRAFWKIYRIICRERPDIVHTHTAKAGALGRLAGILYNVTPLRFKLKADSCKLIHTFHGHVLSGYFGRVKSFVFLWVEKLLTLFTDRIITVSEALKKELAEKFRIAPAKKISVVELGFELEELLKLSLKEAIGVVNIGIVGRLVAVKNHRMLFRVAKTLRQGFRLQARFLIIGDGELKQELTDYVKELGIEDIVEFRGWVRDLKEIYKNLDIVVLTSLNEGTPVSIIEAMAAARPIVATDVGGVRDVVENGKSGYLTDSKDEEGFTERLLDLIRDADKRKRFGEFGRDLVRDRFSKERMIRDTERVYEELAG